MDVKAAFLNGNLDEEVFMNQPEGLVEGKEHIVCKLKRSIYEIKQASRQWYLKCNDTIKSFGFKENIIDQCIYLRINESKFNDNPYSICLLIKDLIILMWLDFKIQIFFGCVDTRKSTFGYLFLLAEGAISWKCAKQFIIVASTMEVEFVAYFEAIIHGL